MNKTTDATNEKWALESRENKTGMDVNPPVTNSETVNKRYSPQDLCEFAEWLNNKHKEVLQRSIEELESISNNYEVINNHYVVKKQTIDNFIIYLQNMTVDNTSDLQIDWEIETGRRKA